MGQTLRYAYCFRKVEVDKGQESEVEACEDEVRSPANVRNCDWDNLDNNEGGQP